MLAATIDTARLAALDRTLSEYAVAARKTPADVVRAKAKQLLTGFGPRGERTPGLYHRIAATAPRKGRVTAERRADSWRLGRPDSKSLLWAKARAAQLYPSRSGSTAIPLYESASGLTFAFRNPNSMAVALAVARRERSRLATATQFLPARYRAMFETRAAASSSAIQNAKGRDLSTARFAATDDGALFELIGNLGLHTSAQIAALNEMLDALVADTSAYIARKAVEALPRP